MIGLRDTRFTQRCKECSKRGRDWCEKYSENINYCAQSCAKEHPDCPRDEPNLHKRLLIYKIVTENKEKFRCNNSTEIELENCLELYDSQRLFPGYGYQAEILGVRYSTFYKLNELHKTGQL